MASSLREDFKLRYPEFPLLNAGKPGDVQALLHRLGWIDADENVLSAEKAGEGNMNLTLRVVTPRRRLILKQSRPWVEKYDHIEAPWDRIHAEQMFYRRVEKIPELVSFIPRFLGEDREFRLMLLEDLAPAKDMTNLYGGTPIDSLHLNSLARFLCVLHSETMEEEHSGFQNRAMRELNHAHIFDLPLSGVLEIPLESYEPGLENAASLLRGRSNVVSRIQDTGSRYLEDGPSLVHGDFFPGSWLSTDKGVRIIDPEFCYFGDPEFDLGVSIAHLAMGGAGLDDAGNFLKIAGIAERDPGWITQYAAAEVIRRLIGVAQLPIPPTKGWRAMMLSRSAETILNEDWRVLFG